MVREWFMHSIKNQIGGSILTVGGVPEIYNEGIPVTEDLDNEITKKYKPPTFLTDLRLHAKTLEEADNGIVYTGRDKTGKRQYVYGVNFINNRHKKRLITVLTINEKLPMLHKFISDNENSSVLQLKCFAILLKLELQTLIRTGKPVYDTKHGTNGILTLKKSALKDGYIEFIGKKMQLQKFIITDKKLWNQLIELKNETPGDYLFSARQIPPEKEFYSLMNDFGFNLKDLRTYGVNNKFLMYIYDNLPFENTKEMKSVIRNAMKSVAEEVQHSLSISKKNYLIPEISKYIYPNDSNEDLSFSDYENEILERIRKGIEFED